MWGKKLLLNGIYITDVIRLFLVAFSIALLNNIPFSNFLKNHLMRAKKPICDIWELLKNVCISTGCIFNLQNLKGNGNKLEVGAVFVCLPIWPPSEPPCFKGTLAGISTDKMWVTVRNNMFVDLNIFRDITVLLSNVLTSH